MNLFCKCGAKASSKEVPHVSGWIVSCDIPEGCNFGLAAIGATEEEAIESWEKTIAGDEIINYELEGENGDTWKVQCSGDSVKFVFIDGDDDLIESIPPKEFTVPMRVLLGFVETNLPQFTQMVLDEKDEDIANLEDMMDHN